MHTLHGEAFEYDPPSFLLSTSYVDGVEAKTIYTSGPWYGG